MELPSIRTFALLLLAFPASAAEVEPTPDPSLTKLVAYVGEVAQVEKRMNQAAVEQTDGQPQIRALMQAAFADFDMNHVAARVAVPLSASLSPAQAAPCLAFIDSEDGNALLAASKKAKSVDSLSQELSKLPTPQQRTAGDFIDSHCFKAVIAFLGSQEARNISTSYGAQLACYYVARTDPEMAERSRKMYGDCSNL